MYNPSKVKELLRKIEDILIEIDGEMSYNDYQESYKVEHKDYTVFGHITDVNGSPVISFDIFIPNKNRHFERLYCNNFYTSHEQIKAFIDSKPFVL